MKKFLASKSFYLNELDELYKLLNGLDREMATSDLSLISVYNDVRDKCLFRIKLLEGWISELSTLEIN